MIVIILSPLKRFNSFSIEFTPKLLIITFLSLLMYARNHLCCLTTTLELLDPMTNKCIIITGTL